MFLRINQHVFLRETMSSYRSEWLPNGITRTHILQAISECKNRGIPIGFKDSYTYCVEHEGKMYPIKQPSFCKFA